MHFSGSKTHARKEGGVLAPRVRASGSAAMLSVDDTDIGKTVFAEHFRLLAQCQLQTGLCEGQLVQQLPPG